jgi:DNA polymerase-3 subunit delta'
MARAAALLQEDVLPESDRLDDFPHPRETNELFGQGTAEQTLLRAFGEGRMHHAWLLCGPAGIGKATLAYRFAKHALASPDERQPATLDVASTGSSVRQVVALSHPGLLVLRRPFDPKAKRFMSAITVDEVRRLRSFLGLTAGEGAWRIVIVDSADDLNPNAANALLKSLEEPPSQTIFLLVSSEPSALLPTIRSRCRRLNLLPLGAEDIRNAAERASQAAGQTLPKADQWAHVQQLAEGSVRRALQFASEGGLASHSALAQALAKLPAVDWPATHVLADALSGSANEQQFEMFCDLLLEMTGHMVRERCRGDTLRAAQLTAAWSTLVRQRSEVDLLNLDRKAFILNVFNSLQQAVDKEHG